MKDILYLVHRIPYPPNKGDKIRSFNILKYLAEHYRIHLGAFVDDPGDWKYREELEGLCAEVCLLPLRPILGKIKSLTGLLTGAPLTVPYYSSDRMQSWVDQTMRQDIAAILVFSSAMAQFVEKFENSRRVIDFVDVDSDKWAQYAAKKVGLARWIYSRESERLLAYDRQVARVFDQSLFVSEQEAALFKQLAPEVSDRVQGIENGVDTVFFEDSGEFSNPYPVGEKILVFTGAMDYWANVDAVTWFADEVFPLILGRIPAARFFIVGARPTEAVQALGQREGVTVTGAVKDIRPYLAHADLAVAPLRIARGIQNKVLEAMAMGRAVIVSPAAIEGIEAENGLDVATADSPADWVDAVVRRLGADGESTISWKNRQFVERRYGWRRSLSRLDALLEPP